jgi:hypothetical protein
MSSVQTNKLLSEFVERAAFERWNRTRAVEGWRYVFAYEYGAIWKFTALEWWRFVSSVVKHNGNYDLPISRALNRRPKALLKDENGKYQSSDASARCVNLRAWSLADWKRELGETGVYGGG